MTPQFWLQMLNARGINKIYEPNCITNLRSITLINGDLLIKYFNRGKKKQQSVKYVCAHINLIPSVVYIYMYVCVYIEEQRIYSVPRLRALSKCLFRRRELTHGVQRRLQSKFAETRGSSSSVFRRRALSTQTRTRGGIIGVELFINKCVYIHICIYNGAPPRVPFFPH